MKSVELITVAKKVLELRNALDNMGYKLQTNPSIRLQYEDEEELLEDDVELLQKEIASLDDLLQLIKEFDSTFTESETNPLSASVIEELHASGRLKI